MALMPSVTGLSGPALLPGCSWNISYWGIKQHSHFVGVSTDYKYDSVADVDIFRGMGDKLVTFIFSTVTTISGEDMFSA